MKPVITFSEDSVGDGAVSVVLSKLVGFTFKMDFDAGDPDDTVLRSSNTLVGTIMRVGETEVAMRREDSAMEHLVPIDQITFMEYQ